MAHPHVDVMRQADEAMARGDIEEFFSYYTDDFETHAYLADDEHGVVLQRGKSVKEGKTTEFNEIFVFHFREGKISEMWYVPTDLAAVEGLIG